MRFYRIFALAAFTAIVFSALACFPAYAANDADTADSRRAPIVWKPSDLKFERGVRNVGTGWLEAPVTVQEFHKERNLFEALTTGIARGVGLAIARTGVGVYEILSFPFPAPEKYEPLMMPERIIKAS